MSTRQIQGSAALRGARTQALKETAATRKALVTNLAKLRKQNLYNLTTEAPGTVIKTPKGSVYVQAKKSQKGEVVWHDPKGNYFVQVVRPQGKFVVKNFAGPAKRTAKSKP
jgi:hypothetical protein